MFTTVIVTVLVSVAATIAAMALWTALRPPARSLAALRGRVNDLETEYATDHTELKRLVKRYRALEGHVYGSIEPDDEELAAPGDLNPSSQPGPGTLALIDDFPEEAFQAAVAARKGHHA